MIPVHRDFPPSWSQQGLHFCTQEGLAYGMVQNEGGPCGPLAVVQALVMAYLLFGDTASQVGHLPSHESPQLRVHVAFRNAHLHAVHHS